MMTVMTMKAMMGTCSLLMLLGLAAARVPSTNSSSVFSPPIVKHPYAGVRPARYYDVRGSCCYSALLLDEERERLFVGAKDYLLSLPLTDISEQGQLITWRAPEERRRACTMTGKDLDADCANFIKILHNFNRTHLFTCGTGAYHPICTYVKVGTRPEDHVFSLDPYVEVEGRGKSPFNASHHTASVLVDGELFSGVAIDLMQLDVTIFKSMGTLPSIRTEKSNSYWLNDPKFVESFWIPETDNPDDDRIFFFFRETALEAQGEAKYTYSRVAHVCKNDMGGEWNLVNQWTTFQKTRLVCSVPEADGSETFFDELQDVFLQQTTDRKNPVVFAVFTTSSKVLKGSAVCQYTMDVIRRAFLGSFTHKEGPNCPWAPYQGTVPHPRPGMCPSNTHGDYGTSKNFPEDVLRFAQSHPLMYTPVYPINRRPLFVQTNVGYAFTQITVDRVRAADGQYDVMFIGTDKGSMIKTINIRKEGSTDVEVLVVEEVEIFNDSSPIINMQLSSKRRTLYLSSNTTLAQVSVERCTYFNEACAECVMARDPYCAWDGKSCSVYNSYTTSGSFKQDVKDADHHTLCLQDFVIPNPSVVEYYVVENNPALLKCTSIFTQAAVHWQYVTDGSNLEKVSIDHRIYQTDLGLLFLQFLKKDAGDYLCFTTEQDFVQMLIKFTVVVIPSNSVPQLLQG